MERQGKVKERPRKFKEMQCRKAVVLTFCGGGMVTAGTWRSASSRSGTIGSGRRCRLECDAPLTTTAHFAVGAHGQQHRQERQAFLS